MMKQNFYKEFASIYDELMDDVDYDEWTGFIQKALPPHAVNLLEAACGTGNITNILADGAYNITAFDISEEMLVKAYDKLRKNRNVRLLNQNMTTFKIGKNFDGIICCCDGVNYLSEQDAKLFFNKVYEHLNNNGSFIFDISTPYKYLNMNETYVYDNEDVFYVWENTFNNENNINFVDMEINFFVKDKDKYKRITELQTHYLHKVEDLKNILIKIGFTNINIYDGYTNNLYNDNSIRATFVCKLEGK